MDNVASANLLGFPNQLSMDSAEYIRQNNTVVVNRRTEKRKEQWNSFCKLIQKHHTGRDRDSLLNELQSIATTALGVDGKSNYMVISLVMFACYLFMKPEDELATNRIKKRFGNISQNDLTKLSKAVKNLTQYFTKNALKEIKDLLHEEMEETFVYKHIIPKLEIKPVIKINNKNKTNLKPSKEVEKLINEEYEKIQGDKRIAEKRMLKRERRFIFKQKIQLDEWTKSVNSNVEKRIDEDLKKLWGLDSILKSSKNNNRTVKRLNSKNRYKAVNLSLKRTDVIVSRMRTLIKILKDFKKCKKKASPEENRKVNDNDVGNSSNDYDSYKKDDKYLKPFLYSTLVESMEKKKLETNAASNNKPLFGKKWLAIAITDHLKNKKIGGMSEEELLTITYDILVSSSEGARIENELLDIFGFDHVDLIQYLLENRSKVVPPKNIKAAVAAVARREDTQPKAKNVKSDFPNGYIKVSSSKTDVVYPYVFDEYKDVKHTPGFVSGTKLLLPENVIRKDTKIWEEVTIPIQKDIAFKTSNNRMPIERLDEICQTVFREITHLNRIQSIVYNTAYNTNENMLICAPTGAGKTNIALLTILREIKCNMDNGLLRKNDFKIIYVAPMKALAAEMTENFSKKLNVVGVAVKEFTGDMQLTKGQIERTQVLVTTPEKWDLITRKSYGSEFYDCVKTLIIDEVHLLHGDRGPVIEALVARTLRQVEATQRMIRIVGLSATLPNYIDVAVFLKVNPQVGLFVFDSRFRPVALKQTFIGIKGRTIKDQTVQMNSICYDKMIEAVREGHQVMVFVHARNATETTAKTLRDMAQQNGDLKYLEPKQTVDNLRMFERAKCRPLQDLLRYGFSIHHAGLLRNDRTLVEKCFLEGRVKVLMCTSTLAWGVNLPAHTVIIKGTDVFDPKRGMAVNLDILDVLQIFGRAGRPQFDTSGHGIIITVHKHLSHYLSLLTNQIPIESRFISCLVDNLNAEISSGSVSNVEEAIEWLGYTYLHVRMRKNPLEYGMTYTEIEEDHMLLEKRRELIEWTASLLDKACMVRYTKNSGNLAATDLGRTASNFYIKYNTIETFTKLLKPLMDDTDIFSMISQADEFEHLKVRNEELDELDGLIDECCYLKVKAGSENVHGKVNILLQTFLSRKRVKSFSLESELYFIAQNAVRISRALFEIALRRSNAIMAARFLKVTLMIERGQWDFQSPLRQFNKLPLDVLLKIEDRKFSIEALKEMDVKEIGFMVRNTKSASLIKQLVHNFPSLKTEAIVQPVTDTVFRIRLRLVGDFVWNDTYHGKSLLFIIWVEDGDSNFMYHWEYVVFTKKQVIQKECQELAITIPISYPMPSQYFIRAFSNEWLHCDCVHSFSLRNISLPNDNPSHTDLLNLQPLPITALKNAKFQKLYKFTHFNAIQTQMFHSVYCTDDNVLLGAPTGSGKTVIAEIAFFRVFQKYPTAKVLYIAPMKALVKERIRDWKLRMEKKIERSVVELTGDFTPDLESINRASIIVATPEKWDSISRSWQSRCYVRRVAVIVIDEIHLLGEERGAVLEAIVSRTRFIDAGTGRSTRLIGLSTAIANAWDLASWLNVNEDGLFNFRPSVRPVPLEVHINAFPGKHYCPRMATMNRPAYNAIKEYSSNKPVLIFVSSRRQTRLTAQDLMASLVADGTPKRWVRIKNHKMDKTVNQVKDNALKVSLAFGIGLHHAGLHEDDRNLVEQLFLNQNIQVLVATATLAWGVNLPAHLVIIKGTEFYDSKLQRYQDMPITDVLQMMGRAGRPQYDNYAIAVVMVHDIKKNFYKKFLYEPFPVESNLLAVLPEHLNAEIVAGTINSVEQAIAYMPWTYLHRRLTKNPSYYECQNPDLDSVNQFLRTLVDAALKTLKNATCVEIDEKTGDLQWTAFGRMASFYYLSYKTTAYLLSNIEPQMSIEGVLRVMSGVHEYQQIPVRHNENLINMELNKLCRFKMEESTLDKPEAKTFLLLQAHFSRLTLPIADYITDLKSVLDQASRIMQGIIDTCAELGHLASTLRSQQILQMISQGRWIDDNSLLTLPFIKNQHLPLFKPSFAALPFLQRLNEEEFDIFADRLRNYFNEPQIMQMYNTLRSFPIIKVDLSIKGNFDDSHEEIAKKVPLNNSRPINVDAKKTYQFKIRLERLNDKNKQKNDNWFVTFGSVESNDIISMSRLNLRRTNVTNGYVDYITPLRKGEMKITVFLISDSYIGLDQQYYFILRVL